MLFYRAALPLSSQTMDYTAGMNRRHRRQIGSPWRKLAPGRQALLVLAYLRKGTAMFAGITAEMGEPFVSRFLPSQIDQLLRTLGVGEIADFGPQEARATYFQGRTDVEIFGAQRLIAATVLPARSPRR
jgi:hypothetical protein